MKDFSNANGRSLLAEATIERCDLCVIGAGIAGLNALSVAAEYLPDGARVVLIDANSYPGGMWGGVYSYSRLHQPHGSFTVGNRDWGWSQPRDYLATGAEVVLHLERCYHDIRQTLNITERFGHRMDRCEPSGEGAMITYRPNGDDGLPKRLFAKKVINAIGFDVPKKTALPLSSLEVASVTPRDLNQTLVMGSDAPVYVVGGGKTAMDTAQMVMAHAPDRRVVLVNGSGSLFLNRDWLFPKGLRRWWRGVLVADLFRDVALRFDGTNEDAIHDYLHDNYGLRIGRASGRFLFGLLSRAERDTIARGLHSVVEDYLVDVVEGLSGPEMILRSGERQKVQPGSLFINCTGHLLRSDRPYAPYLSPNGAILTITPRSLVHFLSSASAYFLTHLFMRGSLAKIPLYTLDGEALNRQSTRAYVAASIALTYHNTLMFMEHLPMSVFRNCGLDMDRIHPGYRRLRALVGIRMRAQRRMAVCRYGLDVIARRFGVKCGPLPGTRPSVKARPGRGANTLCTRGASENTRRRRMLKGQVPKEEKPAMRGLVQYFLPLFNVPPVFPGKHWFL